MTYREAWDVVRVWSLSETRRQLPTLAPSFLADIAHLRVHETHIYRELRVHIEGARHPYCDHKTGKRRADSRQPTITYAALQQKLRARRRTEGDA